MKKSRLFLTPKQVYESTVWRESTMWGLETLRADDPIHILRIAETERSHITADVIRNALCNPNRMLQRVAVAFMIDKCDLVNLPPNIKNYTYKVHLKIRRSVLGDATRGELIQASDQLFKAQQEAYIDEQNRYAQAYHDLGRISYQAFTIGNQRRRENLRRTPYILTAVSRLFTHPWNHRSFEFFHYDEELARELLIAVIDHLTTKT